MGHERVPVVPKSEPWVGIIEKIVSLYSSDVPVSEVAEETLRNVRGRYEALAKDPTVEKTFRFLVAFSHVCGAEDAQVVAAKIGLQIMGAPTPLSVVRALKNSLPAPQHNSEYGQLAIAAAADAICHWYRECSSKQQTLFSPAGKSFDDWRALGQGRGFCELSRLYFGKLTERYLHYYLDRIGSARMRTLAERQRFQHDVKKYTDAVSRHAFETAQITQSFAAGWFNKNARGQLPDSTAVTGFLSHAFGKLREELRIEEEAGR